MMIEFDKNECNSIKSIVIKGNATIDVSSQFIKGKMLMFAKLSLKLFVYDLNDVFFSQTKQFKKFTIDTRSKSIFYIKF